MIFLTCPYIPRKDAEVIAKVGEILEGGWLHENHLEVMKDRLPLSNIDGPMLSMLITQRKAPIRVEKSFFFFTAPARYGSGKIILNANLLGGGLDADELTFLIGACTAGLLIDESPYWYHPRANPFSRGSACPRSILGALVSDLYRQSKAKRLKGVYEYGTELRTVDEGSHYPLN